MNSNHAAPKSKAPPIDLKRLSKSDFEKSDIEPLGVNADAIPELLKQYDHWVCWRLETRDGKRTKSPYDPRTGYGAKAGDPSTWVDFDTALAAYTNGGYDGIGFEFHTDDLVCGIDLDDCRDSVTGELDEWAQQIVDRFNTYTEISPSQTGVKLFLKGKKPKGRNRKDHIEIYDNARFFCVTGHVHGHTRRVQNRQDQLIAFHSELFPTITEPIANGKLTKRNETQQEVVNEEPTDPTKLTDDEIITLVRRAKNSSKFKRLFDRGNTSEYGNDDSAADEALICILAFYTRDAAQLDRLFQRSALMREKWNRQDYRDRTIDKAISCTSEVYNPPPAQREVDEDWLEEEKARLTEEDVPRHRPVVVVNFEESEAASHTMDVLASDSNVFQRAKLLVTINKQKKPPKIKGIKQPRAPWIEPIPKELLRERLTRLALFADVKIQKGVPCLQRTRPPGWLVGAIDRRTLWPKARDLHSLTEVPVLKPDGTVLVKPGYDQDTGLYLACKTSDLPKMSANPTHKDAVKARDRLLNLVCDFPFKAEEHTAAWLASLLTPLARFAFEGPAPLFLIDANSPGVGKTLLATVVARIVTGHDFPVTHYTRDANELRKRLTSVAVHGQKMLLFDNVDGAFGDAVIDAWLTGTVWEDRFMGFNKIVSAPIDCVCYATAHNAQLAGTIFRRICHVRLETKLEKPDKREGFVHDDLHGHVNANRMAYLSDALTILSAFCKAGRPAERLPAWGSFFGWSDLVRQAVVWVGMADPGATREVLREKADPAAAAMRIVLDNWSVLDPKGRGLTAKEVEHKMYGSIGFDRDAPGFLQVVEAIEQLCESDKVTSRQLGNKLRVYEGRIYGNRFITDIGSRKNANIWAVQETREEGG
jgi:primase-polymerase (primpol)-like protein